jgi:hypothetical protein
MKNSDLILRSRAQRGVSKDGPRAAWFETALARLLTMKFEISARIKK